MRYDLAVFIGRFQPFHLGHHQIIVEALEHATKVAIIIGSSNSPRTHRNPFSFEERRSMILGSFTTSDRNRLYFACVEDVVYNDEQWVTDIQKAVQTVYENAFGAWHSLAKVALIGCNKDSTSFYLSLFPQWSSIAVMHKMQLNASDIRADYFSNWLPKQGYFRIGQDVVPASKILPKATETFLENFATTNDFDLIVGETKLINKYKQSWAQSPFPPVFVTVDAIVVQSGHVLLVRRGASPGKGLLALPGGYLEQHETLVEGMLRELREETGIKVPLPVLKGSITHQKTFDAPHRSSLGRVITQAFLIKLTNQTTLPRVKGQDDAEKAMWVPISDVKSNEMFEDHYSIIQSMCGKLP